MNTLEGHIDHTYDGDLNRVHLLMVEMGALALDQVRAAVKSLLQEDISLAQLVIEREATVDKLESDIDNIIMLLIGKRAPVARDLRIVMAFSKAVTDFERIGDEAVKVAAQVITLADQSGPHPSTKLMHDVKKMSKLILQRLSDATECFDRLDVVRSVDIINQSHDLDIEFESSLRHLATYLLEDARNIGVSIHSTLALKSLERIGQHSVNLAEYIVYLVEGVDLRHRGENKN